MKTRSRFHHVVAFAFAAVCAAGAWAETYTWTGGTGTWDVNSGASWTATSTGGTGTVPGADDAVIIPAAAADVSPCISPRRPTSPAGRAR